MTPPLSLLLLALAVSARPASASGTPACDNYAGDGIPFEELREKARLHRTGRGIVEDAQALCHRSLDEFQHACSELKRGLQDPQRIHAFDLARDDVINRCRSSGELHQTHARIGQEFLELLNRLKDRSRCRSELTESLAALKRRQEGLERRRGEALRTCVRP